MAVAVIVLPYDQPKKDRPLSLIGELLHSAGPAVSTISRKPQSAYPSLRLTFTQRMQVFTKRSPYLAGNRRREADPPGAALGTVGTGISTDPPPRDPLAAEVPTSASASSTASRRVRRGRGRSAMSGSSYAVAQTALVGGALVGDRHAVVHGFGLAR